MSELYDDPYGLNGKNPRRVLPQICKNIQLQRTRCTFHAVVLLASATFALLATQPLPRFVTSLIVAPLAVLGLVFDGKLWRWQQRRLIECQRLIQELGETN